MKIILEIANTENIAPLTDSKLEAIGEIMTALVTTGGLTGVKGGQTRIHFDDDGVFQKIEIKYFPWTRRTIDKRRRSGL